jgi:hypothetical protein
LSMPDAASILTFCSEEKALETLSNQYRRGCRIAAAPRNVDPLASYVERLTSAARGADRGPPLVLVAAGEIGGYVPRRLP